MPVRFDITFDYLCPFARNANESVADALEAGRDWQVTFRPFSLAQTKVTDGEPDVWDRPHDASGTRGVRALQWGVAVRDGWPGRFLAFHRAVFAARHEQGADIGDVAVLTAAAESVGVAPATVTAAVAAGAPARTLAVEHAELVKRWAVFGVPTFIVGDEAVFVRSMVRPRPEEIERIVDLIGWTALNEFKRTRIPR